MLGGLINMPQNVFKQRIYEYFIQMFTTLILLAHPFSCTMNRDDTAVTVSSHPHTVSFLSRHGVFQNASLYMCSRTVHLHNPASILRYLWCKLVCVHVHNTGYLNSLAFTWCDGPMPGPYAALCVYMLQKGEQPSCLHWLRCLVLVCSLEPLFC